MFVGSFFIWVMNVDMIVHPLSTRGNMTENSLVTSSNYCYQEVLLLV